MFRTFRLSVPDAARALRRIARPYLWSRQVPAGSGAARLVPGMPEPSVRTTRRFPSSASSSPGNCGQRAHIAEPSRLEKLPAPSRARVCERLSPALPFSFRTALRSPVPFGSLRTALCRSHVSARAALCGTGLCRGGVFAPRRITASGSHRSVAVCTLSYRSNAPYPCRASSKSNRSHRAVSCRSDRSAPRCAGSHGSARTVCAVPGCAERSVRAAPYRSVRVAPECCRVVPCIPCKRSVPVPNHPVLPRSHRVVSCRSDRSAPRCAGSHGSARTVCAVPGCSEAECSRRAVSQRPGRAVVWPCILCRTVQTLRIRAESSRPVPFAPRRSAGYGVSRRREILPAAPPFSDGDCGEDRSDEPKPKPSAPPRSNSQRDPRRQPFRCRRRKRGVPKAARGAVGSRPLPPFLPVVGASDSLLSAAGTARSPVRRHSPNRRR